METIRYHCASTSSHATGSTSRAFASSQIKIMDQSLRANALEAQWLSSFDGVKVLSLDCFDTLLWRKVAAPTDVFYALAASEPFRRVGLSAAMRISAEGQARRNN